MQTSKIIIIAGPTASGKSGLALTLAQQLKGTIINADSMQVYHEIPILSASPSASDCQLIPHKLYGIYDATIRGNVVDWFKLCCKEIKSAQSEERLPIIVGGTGMYIEALTKGITPIPETPTEIRMQVDAILQEKGLCYLYELLRREDSQTASKLSENDTTRIRRAIEVLLHTQKPISYWHTIPLTPVLPSSDLITIYLNPSRDVLDTRCRTRFDIMMEQGAIDEVRALMERNLSDSLPAMRALGVQELKRFLTNQCTLDEAVEEAKIHTRQYAKRQATWFNNRFKADFCYNSYFSNDKNFVDDIKKTL